MGTALLVTGAPGAGKTTLIPSVLAAACRRAGGFVTEEIREDALLARRTVEALR